MTAFVVVWLVLCLIATTTHGWIGPLLATGVMAMIAPFWFVFWAVDAGYDSHCQQSYNTDC